MNSWFVLNTKPKKEFQVERLFEEGGIDFYCPRYIHETRTKPFFPGYGFIYFDYPSQYRLVKYTRGVKQVIGNQEGPIPVSDEIINRERSMGTSNWKSMEKYPR